MGQRSLRWGVVVAAGGLVADPLASAIGTPRKALAMVGGKSSLSRTLEAVKGAGFERCVTVSGEDVLSEAHYGEVCLESDSQIENAEAGVQALGDVDAILFLPADTPFLKAEDLDHFVESVEDRWSGNVERWLAAGVCTAEEFGEAYPEFKSQPLKLRDGAYNSGALYACSPPAFHHARSLLEQFSESRKNQLQMLRRIGFMTIVMYFMHRISIKDAEERLSELFEGEAMVITGCHPRTIADIDHAEDFGHLVAHAERGAKDE